MRPTVVFALTLLALLLWSGPAVFAEEKTIREVPVSFFTDYADFELVKISPSGDQIAAVIPYDNREALVVIRLSDLQATANVAFDRRQGIADFHWANNQRLLVEPSVDDYLYDARLPTGEIYGINSDGSKREMLFGYRAGEQQVGTYMRKRDNEYAWAQIANVLPDDPDNVLIIAYPWPVKGIAQQTNAYKMNVFSGRLVRVATTPNSRGNFISDGEGRVVFSYGVNARNELELYRRTDQEWQLISTAPYGFAVRHMPIHNTGNGDQWFVGLSDVAPTTGLATVDFTSPGTEKELFRHDAVDIGPGYYDYAGKNLWAVRYDPHYPEYFYPDSNNAIASMHRSLRATFKNSDVAFTSFTADNRKAIAHVTSDTNAGEFYLVDLQNKSATYLLNSRPRLKDIVLATVEAVDLKVRDGTTALAYLTLPPGRNEKNLLLVVLPHGGPHGIRDYWGFDAAAQLLANRGYAVLQMNFRGSGGFGGPFARAGHGEWGARMQDDLTDATRWAIESGLADPQRVCIFGASYGGYAALMGTVREPDLYRCAIGYVGIYDLQLMFDEGDIPDSRSGREYLRAVLGTDPVKLTARSPVHNVDRIKAAVMLVVGEQDRRVPPAQGERMREALEKAGKPPEWVYESAEGNGFFEETNREALYTKILAFLEKHIGKGAPAKTAVATMSNSSSPN